MRESPVDMETLILRQLFLQYRQDILVCFASMDRDLVPTGFIVSGLCIASEPGKRTALFAPDLIAKRSCRRRTSFCFSFAG